MALHGVNHWQSGVAESGDQLCDRRDDCSQQRHVIAEALSEPSGLDEISLHVDDDQRCRCRIELEVEGFGGDYSHQ